MQNLVFLTEPSKDAEDINLEVGNMFLNRFSIDEDAAFEVSDVHYLKKTSSKRREHKNIKYFIKNKSKGKEYLSMLLIGDI